MPTHCVVGGCMRASTKHSGINFHRFPSKDVSLCRAWVQFVDSTRPNFKLSKWSRICSEHFPDECREITARLQKEFGQIPSFRLKDSSVPTLKAPRTPSKVKKSTLRVKCRSSSTSKHKRRSPRGRSKKTSGAARVSPPKRAKTSGGTFCKRERILQEVEHNPSSVAHENTTSPGKPELQSSWMEIYPKDHNSMKTTVDVPSGTRITDQAGRTDQSVDVTKPKKRHLRFKQTQTETRRFIRSKDLTSRKLQLLVTKIMSNLIVICLLSSSCYPTVDRNVQEK